jgi:hypothetical protein
MSNVNAQFAAISTSYPTVSKNHCLSMLHVFLVCGCGWTFLSLCINNTGSAAFKHFEPPVHTSLWQKVLSILSSQLSMDLCPIFSFRHQKTALLHVACPWCKTLVEQSSLCHAHLAQTDWTEPHLQHVTVWHWPTVWPGISSVSSNTMKIFQYCPYFYNLLFIIFKEVRFVDLECKYLLWN